MAALVFAGSSALAQMGGYSGPQILSRGGSNIGDRPGGSTGFQFYAGVYGTFETGLVPASVDAQGHVFNPAALYGIGARFGAYGRHAWRRTTLGLDYSGNVRHYNQNSYYDGSDHMVAMRLT